MKTAYAMQPATQPHDPAGGPAKLSPRQLEVLALLCEGLSNKLIARQLSISTGTVKAHISSILRGLGVSSRLQAFVRARESGLLGRVSASAEEQAAESMPAYPPKPRSVLLASRRLAVVK